MFVSSLNFDFSAIEHSTLIIPSISLGNVPQLTIDLLIETLKFNRIGIWDTCCLIPVSGPAAYSHSAVNEFSFNGEVYFNKELKITLLQFRAPVVKGLMTDFVIELGEIISHHKFKEVIVLSSYDMTLRVDSQIQDSNPRWLSHNRSLTPAAFVSSGFKQLEQDISSERELTSEVESFPQLPGSGFTRKLLLLAQKKSLDQVVALFTFVSEGDNRIDAASFASSLAEIIDLKAGNYFSFVLNNFKLERNGSHPLHGTCYSDQRYHPIFITSHVDNFLI